MELPYSTELFPVYAVLTASINNEKRILIITFFTLAHIAPMQSLVAQMDWLHKRQINFVPIALAMADSRDNKI